MLGIVDITVNYLYSVMLAGSALIALILAPPVGLLLLIVLRNHINRDVSRRQRPRLQIRLS